MAVSVESILVAQRYDVEDEEFVETLLEGAEAFLKSAGAYHENNALTDTAIHLIVGCWLENRELSFTEYKNTNQFPIGIQSIITQLQYLA